MGQFLSKACHGKTKKRKAFHHDLKTHLYKQCLKLFIIIIVSEVNVGNF